MNRGDMVIVRFPHPSGLRGKKRPAVIVQSEVLVTVYADTVAQVLGTLSPTMNQKLHDCLKAALQLP